MALNCTFTCPWGIGCGGGAGSNFGYISGPDSTLYMHLSMIS